MDTPTAQQNMDSVYLTEEHAALREQVARFIAREVEPHGAAWEEQGCVPRQVLRKQASQLRPPEPSAYKSQHDHPCAHPI